MDRVTKGSLSLLCVCALPASFDTVIASFSSELTIPCYQISIKAFIGFENPSLISASSNFIDDRASSSLLALIPLMTYNTHTLNTQHVRAMLEIKDFMASVLG